VDYKQETMIFADCYWRGLYLNL